MTISHTGKFASATLALLGFFVASSSQAEFVLSFGFNETPGVNEFVVHPGTEFEINVFVEEMSSTTHLNDPGVGAAFFDLRITGNGVRHVSENGFWTPVDSGFRVVSEPKGDDLLALNVEIQTGEEGGSDLIPVRAESGRKYLLLGTVVLQIDPEFTGQVAFEGIPDVKFGGALTIGSNPFTTSDLAGATATITAVPEPGSVAGLAALVIGGALVHRRRLRGRQAMRTPRNC